MKMWLCRDEDGLLNLFFGENAPQKKIVGHIVVWQEDPLWGSIQLPDADHPEVTFENSPMEVELVIKK